MLQSNSWLQIPFRFKIGIHCERWYLGQTGRMGYLCMHGFNFSIDLIVPLTQTKVDVER